MTGSRSWEKENARRYAAWQAQQERLRRQQQHRLRKHHWPILFRWLAARGGQRG